MAIIIAKKIVLPTPTEFVRWISTAILMNQMAQRDTSIEVTPRVSRALSLVDKQGVMIVDEAKDTSNG